MKSPRFISFIIWDKIVSREVLSKLKGYSGIEYLHQERPEIRLKKALMQIVARTETALFPLLCVK